MRRKLLTEAVKKTPSLMAREKQSSSSDAYYIVIRGKKYDRRMVELADGLTQGRGDGRISINDAKNLLRVVKDANNYSDTEKRTMEYIRRNYRFTKEGDEFFRTEIRKWAASKKGRKKSAPAQAKSAPPVAPAPAALVAEPAEVSTPAAPAKKPSAWKVLLLALLLLIALAALFYFIVYRSGCAVPKQEATAPTVEAPPVATTQTPQAPAPTEAGVPTASAELRDFVAAQKLAFRAEKTELTAASVPVLDALAERLKKENARIRVTGHSCALGPKSINQKISEKRAQVVKDALVGRGIAAERIETRGAADSEPAGDNRTVAGRVASRRVTFSIIP
jgi:outer membrane protein OmpA-like peptidoglycan-associated protein